MSADHIDTKVAKIKLYSYLTGTALAVILAIGLFGSSLMILFSSSATRASICASTGEVTTRVEGRGETKTRYMLSIACL